MRPASAPPYQSGPSPGAPESSLGSKERHEVRAPPILRLALTRIRPKSNIGLKNKHSVSKHFPGAGCISSLDREGKRVRTTTSRSIGLLYPRFGDQTFTASNHREDYHESTYLYDNGTARFGGCHRVT